MFSISLIVGLVFIGAGVFMLTYGSISYNNNKCRSIKYHTNITSIISSYVDVNIMYVYKYDNYCTFLSNNAYLANTAIELCNKEDNNGCGDDCVPSKVRCVNLITTPLMIIIGGSFTFIVGICCFNGYLNRFYSCI